MNEKNHEHEKQYLLEANDVAMIINKIFDEKNINGKIAFIALAQQTASLLVIMNDKKKLTKDFMNLVNDFMDIMESQMKK